MDHPDVAAVIGLDGSYGMYGEEAAAKYAESLSKRIRNGEFTLDQNPQ